MTRCSLTVIFTRKLALGCFRPILLVFSIHIEDEIGALCDHTDQFQMNFDWYLLLGIQIPYYLCLVYFLFCAGGDGNTA